MKNNKEKLLYAIWSQYDVYVIIFWEIDSEEKYKHFLDVCKPQKPTLEKFYWESLCDFIPKLEE